MEEILAVFGRAQAAVAAGDWSDVFGLLDDSALQAVGKNSLIWLAGQDAASWEIYPELVPVLYELQGHFERISASARRVLAATGTEQMALSLVHRDLVKAQEACLKAAVKKCAAALGPVEALRRSRGQGGSISSRLFQGERLENVMVEGKRAVANRVYSAGSSQRLHFIRGRQGWKIQLMKGS